MEHTLKVETITTTRIPGWKTEEIPEAERLMTRWLAEQDWRTRGRVIRNAKELAEKLAEQ